MSIEYRNPIDPYPGDLSYPVLYGSINKKYRYLPAFLIQDPAERLGLFYFIEIRERICGYGIPNLD